MFCITPNDSQLPNQLERRSVKGQVRSLGLAEIVKRCVTMFEVNMTLEEFQNRCRSLLTMLGIHEGTAREQVEQVRTALGLLEKDVVLGLNQVRISTEVSDYR